MIHKRMTNEEVMALNEKYFNAEGYTFPTHYEHRVDPDSSAVIYSMIREFKPTNILQAGCWKGGTTGVMMAALLKNNKEFKFVASEILDDLRAETAFNVEAKCGQAPEMIGDISKYIPTEEIDCFYHDTNHDRETTEMVFRNIVPNLKKGALVMFHDWAVTENENGEWLGKGDNGVGGWPETEYMLELHRAGKFPFEPVYWNYKNPGGWELGVFLNK